MLSDRLKKLRMDKGISQAVLAKILGVSQQTIGSWEVNRTSPDSEMIKKIANFFNQTTDYLLDNSIYGNTDKIYGNNKSTYNGLYDLPSERKKIPIIGSVKCGANGLAFEELEGYVYVDDGMGDDVKAFKCWGDSMTGVGIFDGDIAIVQMQDNVESGDIAIVTINGNEGTLKRVIKHDGAIILEAANPSYPARAFVGEEMNTLHIVGKVIQIRRNL